METIYKDGKSKIIIMNPNHLPIFYNDDVNCDMTKCGIYAISNIINGKIYVGQTSKSFSGRYYGHSQALFTGNHPNKHLQNSYNLYGKDSFCFHIIEIVENVNNSELDNLEIYWIREYRNALGDDYVFNYSDGGSGGINPTKEVRNKISNKRKQFMQDKHNADRWYAATFSEEAQTLRTENVRLFWSDEQRRKDKAEFMRKMYEDPDFAAKMRIAYANENRNRKISEYMISYMSNPANRKHLSELAIERWSDENERKSQSERRKKYCHSDIGKAQLSEIANRPEVKSKLVQRNHERFKDQSERDNIAEHNRKAWADPEARVKRIENIRKAKQSPEGKAKSKAAQAKRWANPEARKKSSELAKQIWAKRKAKNNDTSN